MRLGRDDTFNQLRELQAQAVQETYYSRTTFHKLRLQQAEERSSLSICIEEINKAIIQQEIITTNVARAIDVYSPPPAIPRPPPGPPPDLLPFPSGPPPPPGPPSKLPQANHISPSAPTKTKSEPNSHTPSAASDHLTTRQLPLSNKVEDTLSHETAPSMFGLLSSSDNDSDAPDQDRAIPRPQQRAIPWPQQRGIPRSLQHNIPQSQEAELQFLYYLADDPYLRLILSDYTRHGLNMMYERLQFLSQSNRQSLDARLQRLASKIRFALRGLCDGSPSVSLQRRGVFTLTSTLRASTRAAMPIYFTCFGLLPFSAAHLCPIF
jgi:hypothetical protein